MSANTLGADAPQAGPAVVVPQGQDRSARPLAGAAERRRTDPDINFEHCAARGPAAALGSRLDDRMPVPAEAPEGCNGEIVTAGSGRVAMRWLSSLTAGCRGAVDLTMTGPLGPVAKAVPFGEALAVAMMIDLLCPGSTLWVTITQLATGSPRSGGQR